MKALTTGRPFSAALRYVALAALVNVLTIAALFWTDAPRAAEPVRILALGDSLTAGYGLPTGRAFTDRLGVALAELGVEAKIQQGGVSGDTSAGGLARLDWALASKPQIAIVALGGNDGLRALKPAETRANLDAILTKLKAAGVSVLLAGMYAPPNLGREYGEEFNAIYPALAKKHGVALYPFFLEGVAARPHLNQPDGIHPNEKGADLIARKIAPHVKRLIVKRSAQAR